jgi:hypothetical protein
MTEFFSGEGGKLLVGMIAIVTIFGSPFIVAGWALWLKHRKNEIDAELKREMIQKGMSADDILRVLKEGTKSK